MERPAPLVARDLRLEVPERLAADGSVLLPLDEAGAAGPDRDAAAREDRGVGDQLPARLRQPGARGTRPRPSSPPRCPTWRSRCRSEVCREIREYERTSTTVANAYVLPLMASYLGRMRAGLAGIGVTCPLLLMMSSGGICTVETARRFPVRLVESGPAGGVILARRIAALRRLRPSAVLRHGRHHRQDHPDRRLHAAAVAPFRGRPRLPLRQGQRHPGAHPGHRHGGDRRRRRLDRAASTRCAASLSAPTAPAPIPAPPATAAAATSADRHRRRRRARPHRSRRLRRRQDRARPGQGARPRSWHDVGTHAGHEQPRKPRAASPRSSTKTWPAPPASTPSRTARTPPAAP